MTIKENIQLIKKYQKFLNYTFKAVILFILLAIFVLLLIIVLREKDDKNEYSQEVTTISPSGSTQELSRFHDTFPMHPEEHRPDLEWLKRHPWFRRNMFCFITCKKNPSNAGSYCNCDKAPM